jgi:uncharacterized protein (TIGR02996 family)
MNLDGAALMRAILDDPEDDVSRLVFADWLEENGNEARAQCIRAMVEAARLAPSRETGDQERFAKLTSIYCSLLAKNESQWRSELPTIPGISWFAPSGRVAGPTFQRGFVNFVAADSWPILREQAQTLFEATPIERLSLRLDSPQECRELAGWPYGRHLKALELRESQTDGLLPLAKSAYWGKLRRLDLFHHRDFIRFSEVLATPFFQNLETLRLLRTAPHPGDLLPIFEQHNVLHHLQLRRLEWHLHWDLTPYLDALLQMPPPQLNWLHLESDAGTGDEMARRIARSPHSMQLRRLVLRRTGLTEIGARLLAQSDYLEDLELLDVRQNPLDAQAVAVLRDRFDLDSCQLLIAAGGPS